MHHSMIGLTRRGFQTQQFSTTRIDNEISYRRSKFLKDIFRYQMRPTATVVGMVALPVTSSIAIVELV